jgi:energy-converting hydrogenase Eha subunit A
LSGAAWFILTLHRLGDFTRYQRDHTLSPGADHGYIVRFAISRHWLLYRRRFFAPAIGQTLGYIGMERIGVARSSPIVNTSPMFSSIFAVLFLGEIWLARNIIGTCLVILGVVILSSSKPTRGHWNKKDIVYPVLAALAFGISTMLRKTGLMTELRGHRKDRRCPVGSDR